MTDFDRDDYREPERVGTLDLSICPNHQIPDPGRTMLYIYSFGSNQCQLIFAVNPKGEENVKRKVLAEFEFDIMEGIIVNDALD